MTAWLQLKKSTDIPVSQIATTHYRTVPLTGKGGQFNTDFLAGQSPIRSSVPPCIASYRTRLGKVLANIAAPSACLVETRTWEDLEKPYGPSLSPGAGSVLAKTVPSVFAQPVPKTSSDAEPPATLSDCAAWRLYSVKRRDVLISPSWTVFYLV